MIKEVSSEISLFSVGYGDAVFIKQAYGISFIIAYVFHIYNVAFMHTVKKR